MAQHGTKKQKQPADAASLDGVALFLRVVEAGSFTAAARRLTVPTSTVTRIVSRLEQSLRVRLVHREARRLVLTEAGRRLVAQASPHVAALQEAAVAAQAEVEQPSGTLRVAAGSGIGASPIGELLTRFVAQYPLVSLELDLSPRAVDLVAEGFDVALRASGKLQDDSRLVARRLAESTMGVFAAPDYLARRGTPTTVEALSAHDCVLFRPKNGRNVWVLSGPDGRRSVEVTGRLSSSDLPFIRDVVRLGVGLGMFPLNLASEDVRAGRLVRVLPGYTRRGGTLYVVYPAARHLPRKVAVFRDFFLAHAARLGPPLEES